jgi:hypothetical protein
MPDFLYQGDREINACRRSVIQLHSLSVDVGSGRPIVNGLERGANMEITLRTVGDFIDHEHELMIACSGANCGEHRGVDLPRWLW